MSRLLRAAGATLLLAGLLAVALDRSPGVTVPEAAVLLLGVGSLFLGFRALVGRWTVQPERARPPDVEDGTRVPVPGDALDATAGRRGSHQAFLDRAEQRVLATLVTDHGFTVAAAVDCVDAGRWTTDPVAASALRAELSVDLRTRIRWWFTTPGRRRREVAERTVASLAALRRREVEPA